MGKVRQSQLVSGRGINDRKYKAEGNYQHFKPKWEEDRLEKAKASACKIVRGAVAIGFMIWIGQFSALVPTKTN